MVAESVHLMGFVAHAWKVFRIMEENVCLALIHAHYVMMMVHARSVDSRIQEVHSMGNVSHAPFQTA